MKTTVCTEITSATKPPPWLRAFNRKLCFSIVVGGCRRDAGAAGFICRNNIFITLQQLAQAIKRALSVQPKPLRSIAYDA